MKLGTTLLAGLGLILTSLLGLQACSSAQATDDSNDGVDADDNSSDDDGPSTGDDTGPTSDVPMDIIAPFNTDPSCNSASAETGAACTKDCQLGCGFQEMGDKYCSCESGAYSACPCNRPAEFDAAPYAQFCTEFGAADGLSANLKGNPCDAEFDICIGQDDVSGSTPQGCACLVDNISSELKWFCGSTNKWFDLEPEGGVPDCPIAADGVSTCYPLNTDASCTSSDAKTGAVCSRDCQIGCGFQGIGTKLCSCSGGAYSQCPCPRPETFLAAAEAPLCGDAQGAPDGLTEPIKGLPCETEWEACIGTDAITGTTPRGCVCMMHPTEMTLQWSCGSTNKWFKLEGT